MISFIQYRLTFVMMVVVEMIVVYKLIPIDPQFPTIFICTLD